MTPTLAGTKPTATPPNSPSQTPDILQGIAPRIGQIWEWEPLNERARATLKVTDVRWNGEELFVESQNLHKPHHEPSWNEFGHWVQATVLIDFPDSE